MNASFQSILDRIIRERGTAIFETASKCNALLQDYTQGQFKRDSRLLLQSLEAGAHKELLQPEDPDISKQKMIRKLQDEYGTAKEAAEEIITSLALVLGNRGKTEEEKTAERIARLESTAKNGDHKAQLELGTLLSKLKRFEEAAKWFEMAARHGPNLDKETPAGHSSQKKPPVLPNLTPHPPKSKSNTHNNTSVNQKRKPSNEWMNKTKITVKRENVTFLSAIAMNIIIDDKYIMEIDNDSTQTFYLENGGHTIAAETGFMTRSRKASFSTHSGELFFLIRPREESRTKFVIEIDSPNEI
jgi:tetratricopeptide (TPR) repeat protein